MRCELKEKINTPLSLAELVEEVNHQRRVRRRDKTGSWVDARPKIKSGRPKTIRNLNEWMVFFYDRCDSLLKDKCWNWTGRKMRNGYGKFVFEGYEVSAHRFSWLIHNGRIPGELCVLHRCDNKPCVNPAHLFLGTKGDNNRDCAAKGRKNPFCKIKDYDIPKLRSEYIRGTAWKKGNSDELAKKYGVSKMHLLAIIRGALRAKPPIAQT